MKPKKHRRVVAKKEHICKECKNSIAKDEICVQGGSDYYHDDCYSALRLMLEEVYRAPKLLRRNLQSNGILNTLHKDKRILSHYVSNGSWKKETICKIVYIEGFLSVNCYIFRFD